MLEPGIWGNPNLCSQVMVTHTWLQKKKKMSCLPFELRAVLFCFLVNISFAHNILNLETT